MPKKILFIEDDLEIIRLYSIMLIRSEFDLIIQHNSRDALASAIGMKPDLILLDTHMEYLDNIKVLHQLKTNKHTQLIPVAMVTDTTDTHDIEEAKKLGAIDCWEKNKVSPSETYTRIRKILKI